MRAPTLCLAATLGLLACSATELPPITDCETARGIEPLCGFQNPEDLAVLPGERGLLVSQYGAVDQDRPGSLALFTLPVGPLTRLYPAGDADAEARPDRATAGWGEPGCSPPDPTLFSPHGIHLSQRSDGARQLLVVNHGGRESVEFFQVSRDETEAGFRVDWRGCSVAPEGSHLNSVVATPEGGFLTTHMFDPSSGWFTLMKGRFGMGIGHVLEWRPDRGFSVMAGTETAMPNGIEISDDGAFIYLNIFMGGEVRRIERATGKTVAFASVAGPDNIRWNRDGTRLLVASLSGSMSQTMACVELQQGACPAQFDVLSLHPDTLEATSVLTHPGGPPMGGVTVAVEAAGHLYMGSFAGDRLARLPLSP